MKKSKILMYFLMIGVMNVFVVPPSSAFLWPTLDIKAIAESLKGNKEKVDQTLSTSEKTALTAEELEAMGAPSSAAISEDKIEKAKKSKEKAEKVQKRAEWLKKKKEQYEKWKKRYETTKKYTDQGKTIYNKGKTAYDAVEEGDYGAALDLGKDIYDDTKDTYDDFRQDAWDGEEFEETEEETKSEEIPENGAENESLPQDQTARRPFGEKTSSLMEGFFSQKESLAFAQVADSEYKTGSNETGDFIFSDIIANKCDMGLEDVSFEAVQQCVKTWVLLMNDPNATTAMNEHDEYTKALHDHVSANAALSLDNMGYASSFKQDVIDDLSEKSEKTTSIRDESAFIGKMMLTNAGLMARILQDNSSALIYDSLLEVEGLSKDYYKEDEDQK